jgi:hypothetical protein
VLPALALTMKLFETSAVEFAGIGADDWLPGISVPFKVAISETVPLVNKLVSLASAVY